MHAHSIIGRGFILGIALGLAGIHTAAFARSPQSHENEVTEKTATTDSETPAEESPVLVVPSSMGYQGFLTDNGGVAINGNVSLAFRIWTAAVGGASLWGEVQNPVLVQDGVFSVGLGDVNPLPTSIFDGTTPLWLGISVNGEPELPRTQLRTSPFAYNAQLLDGLSSSDYIKKAGDSMTGTLGLDGGVIGHQTGGVTEMVESTTDVLLRRYFLDTDTGTGSWSGRAGRVIISCGGQGTPQSTGGSGVATIMQGLGTIATINIPADGGRPWTYIVEIPDLGLASTLDVAVRANVAGDPVLVRSIILETDNSGAAGAHNTLDQAYDQGGAGAGRTILADAGAVFIRGTDGLDVLGPVNLGDAVTNGRFTVAADGFSSSLTIDATGQGSEVVMQDEAGGYTFFLQPDFSGDGGFLEVTRSGGASGFYVDGNAAGTHEPFVTVTGSARSASFDMSTSGDASVVLPTSSISSTEMLNEPGISQGKVDGSVTVTGAIAAMIDIVTTSITIPSDGYIVLTASAQAGLSGSTTGNYMSFQIDETAGGSTDLNHYYNVGWSTDSPDGLTWEPVQTQRTYFKTAGTYTFRFEAKDGNGSGSKYLWNPVLTARFFPTGYGTVSERPAGPELGQFTDVSYRETGTNGPGTVSESAPLVDLRELEIRALQAEAEAAQLRQQVVEAQLAAQHEGRSE
jgi:hypothetical protein